MYALSYSCHISPAPDLLRTLAISAVGQFRAEAPYTCNRLNGWNVEHLVLTTGGTVTASVNGNSFKLIDGSFLITPADSRYSFSASDDPCFWEGYWIEYHGAWCRDLLRINGLEGRYHLSDDGGIRDTMESVIDLFRGKGAEADREGVALLALLLARAGMALRRRRDKSDPVRNAVDKAKRFVRNNLERPIGLPEMADAAGMSKYHFLRLFRGRTGFTPAKYIFAQRMSRARELIRTTSLNISEVAYETGFATPQHFSNVFKKETGLSPREFLLSVRD